MNKKFYCFLSSSYLHITILVFLVFGWTVWGKNFSIFYPWQYSGDSIFASMAIKSLIETGSFLTNDALGFPNGYQLYDFPIDELGNFFIIYIESLFTSNYAVILNVFYFLTFLFSALTSVYTCKKLGLSKAFSLLVSILFAFSPYHFFRAQSHLFLSAYFSIPIYTLAMLFIFKHKKIPKQPLFFLSLALLFCASTGIYYAFFACYFFMIIGFSASIFQKNWRPLLHGIGFIAIIGLGVLINLLPSILYHIHHGINEMAVQRSPYASEFYGLKIISLLIPNTSSGFSLVPTNNYYRLIGGENLSSYLGIIGSLGFLFLLFVSLNTQYLKNINQKIIALSTLNLSATLLGTIGGFGALFAYTISPQIRCYNRISIFILYFSLLGIALFLQRLLSRYDRYRFCSKNYSWLTVSCLCVFGLYSQIGHITGFDYTSVQQKINNDKNFVKIIEASLPQGSAVFQLPYFPFPESPPIHYIPDYDYFRGYLNSSHLKWSGGAMKGRSVANWQESVSKKPASELLKDITLAGFSGLYIDRNGYEDHGKSIETSIESLIQAKPIISENGQFAFFDLKSYAKTRLSNLSVLE